MGRIVHTAGQSNASDMRSTFDQGRDDSLTPALLDRNTRASAHVLAELVYDRCLDAGPNFKISAGRVLTLLPPIVIVKDDFEWAMSIVEEAIFEA